MSWSIHLISCDVEVDEKTAEKLKADDYDEIFDEDWKGGKLPFCFDHDEHADWLSNREDLVEILKKARAKGKVLWCSHEGDNRGGYWGHEFDGKGGYFPLSGELSSVVWKRVK